MPFRIHKRSRPAVPLSGHIQEEAWLRLPLNRYWDDSLVAQVGFATGAIAGINDWINAGLEEQPVRETGGFLLGQVRELEDDRWDVGVVQFCPAVRTEFRSPNRLAFGTGALMDLDEALHTQPDLILCGWLHTHPGFTPYLSQMDLAIHDGFFRMPWHIAVVLDPLTAAWDTGIFSRQGGGRINNQSDHKGQWMSWDAFCRDHSITSP